VGAAALIAPGECTGRFGIGVDRARYRRQECELRHPRGLCRGPPGRSRAPAVHLATDDRGLL